MLRFAIENRDDELLMDAGWKLYSSMKGGWNDIDDLQSHGEVLMHKVQARTPSWEHLRRKTSRGFWEILQIGSTRKHHHRADCDRLESSFVMGRTRGLFLKE